MLAIPWILVALAAATLIARALFGGYPPPRLPRGALLGRKEQAIIAAAADALFPPGGPIPVSGTEAGLVAYMDAYLSGLPAAPRFLVRLLFHSVEHAPWIFGPRRVRFTHLAPAERIAALGAMAESPLYLRRVSFLSMRTVMTMGYLACPAVAARMGMVADLAPFAPHPSRPPPPRQTTRRAFA
jgi:hypothetical protein